MAKKKESKLYIYIYIYVCVCVCVRKREERERERKDSLFLFLFQSQLNEDLLQLFVAVINDKLLKAVVLQAIETQIQNIRGRKERRKRLNKTRR